MVRYSLFSLEIYEICNLNMFVQDFSLRWKVTVQLNFRLPKQLRSSLLRVSQLCRNNKSLPDNQSCTRCSPASYNRFLFRFLLVSRPLHQMGNLFNIIMSL